MITLVIKRLGFMIFTMIIVSLILFLLLETELFAKLWVDPKKRLIAYIGFPLTPPGDNELLAEFEERVYESL